MAKFTVGLLVGGAITCSIFGVILTKPQSGWFEISLTVLVLAGVAVVIGVITFIRENW